MWYKTLKAITYVDETGTERRANVGSVVNIERRAETKRLRKEGAIIDLDKADENIGADFILKEKLTDPPVPEDTRVAKLTPDSPEAGEPAANGLTVGALVQYGEDVGEVVDVSEDSVTVKLSEDESVKVKPADVEVLG